MKKLKSIFILILLSTFSYANDSYWTTADNGKQILVKQNPAPIPVESGSGSSITTTFADNNSFAGNMFDVTVLGTKPISINSFDINIEVNGSPTCQISVYYRVGTYVGHESSSTGWILADAVSGVVPQGAGNATSINTADFTLETGQTYGFYITVSNYPAASMNYTNGNNVYSDANLQITTGIGKGDPDFTGETFNPRTWNGTIYYSEGDPVPFPYWSSFIIFGLISGFIVIRFRTKIF